MKPAHMLAFFCASSILAAPIAAAPAVYDQAQWSGLKYRQVGPWRGGRVTTVTGVPSQPSTFYMGTVGGGVWKTTDAGQSWKNTSDGQIPVGSMGAVAVAETDPNIIYAGTGSSKIRSNVSIGRGIYKSTDGAKTWSFIGLRDVGQIATVRINPTNANEVFVAALGNPFANSKARGVYRTRDGGKTWKQVLFLSDELGAADLELQPGNPQVVYATMWRGQRKPWTIISGGREGGIYKSTDGGDTWNKLTSGLPNGLFGRSNVGVSQAAPNRLYALIEAKPGHGLYRSDDAGANWTLVNGEDRLVTRPFYYTTLGVDPNNPDLVFVGNEAWFKSLDGGKTFKPQRTPHADNHDVWINPRNSMLIVQANDGGANVSLDGGATWSTQANQPTAELYQVAVDDQFPYRLYGAQQDNTTLIVPSRPLGNDQEFRTGPGCETGPIMPKTGDPNIVWGACKGQFSRMDIRTNGNDERYWVGMQSLYGADPDDLIYRFQRVAPMELSPTDPNTVYYGSQYVHRTRDGGITWERISPDLTARPPGTQYPSGEPITLDVTGEEVYSTLYQIRESRLKPGVIWTGSNDGLLFVSQDGGTSWKNVTPKGLPPGGRVQTIEPGQRDPGTAYVAIYRYLLGDFAPYIYRTDNYGRTWTRLTDGRNGIAADEPTRVVREDPERPGLLYAGTEFGIYVSFDRGERWQSFQMNLPAVPVTDIRLAHGDLVMSTQGRGFWILDNLGALRQLKAPAEAVRANQLYKPAVAVRIPASADFGPAPGTGPEYPLNGAQIDYYLAADATAAPLTLTILDANGRTVRSFTSKPVPAGGGGGGGEDELGNYRPSYPGSLKATRGMHRFTWDLRYSGVPELPAAPAVAPAPASATPHPPSGPAPGEGPPGGMNPDAPAAARVRLPIGPVAAPGNYTIVLSAGSYSERQPLRIVEDPRVTASGVSDADLAAQLEHNLRVLRLVNDTALAASRITAAQSQLRTNPDPARAKALQGLANRLITPRIRYSQPGLQTHVTYLYGATNATDQKVGRDAIERYGVLRQQIDALIEELNAVLGPPTDADLQRYVRSGNAS
ncbi:MAG: hypothetical protein M3N39_11085 [Pseudomonadota bacterium]|nr:hypothetical protein [Pseudomonadota bacterium]